MSTLKVGAIQSTTGNAAMTVANNGNLTIPQNVTFNNVPSGIGNNYIRLAQTSVTSAVATVDFNSSVIDSSTYRNFFFTYNCVTCVSGNYDLILRFSSDNLSSFMTCISQMNYRQINGGDTGHVPNRGNHILTEDEENDETNASTGFGYIMNANRKSSNNNTTNMFIFSEGTTINDNTVGYYSYDTNSVCGSGSDPLNAIRFSGATNITAGIFTIYGIPN
tara:strand:- start:1450 stop:2109 length:660 start_codon:yes stop_codon:yes gene_type:complete